MSVLQVIATIVFTLAVDVFGLWRFLRWPWLRAVGVGILMNVASLVGAAVAYEIVAGRLPLSWTVLHVWVRYHLWMKLLFFAVAYGATVAVECVVVRFWEEERRFARVVIIVALMNLVTMVPGVVESVVAGWPRVGASFTLEGGAQWAESGSSRLYYFDYVTRRLMMKSVGANTGEVVSGAVPAHGYRVGADGRVCILSLTNTLVMSWLGVTGRHEVTVPTTVTNVMFVDCGGEGNWYAVANGGEVRMYTLPENALTARVDVGRVDFLVAVKSGGVTWGGNGTGSVLTLNGLTNTVATPEPFWCWAPHEERPITATFVHGSVTITVRDGEGLEITTPTYTDRFTVVRGMRYRGLDFTPDGRTFVFAAGSEILALDVATRRVGHVCLGVAPIFTSKQWERP